METGTISSTLRKKVSVAQTRVDLTVQPQNDENIQKVLGAYAKAHIINMEILNGEANYTASVLFNVAYLNDDKKICALEEDTTVTSKIDDNSLSSLMEPIYKIEVVDVSIESASSTEVRVSATLEITLEVLDFNEISSFNPTDPNILVKQENHKVLTKCDCGKSVATIEEEFDIKQKVDKVLCKQAQVCIKQLTAGTGYYTIEGELYLKAYLCVQDDEQYSYKLFNETIPFKEEIDAENMQKECTIEATVCVKNNEVKFEVLDEEHNTLKVSVPLLIRYVALKEDEVLLPCDAYSLTHKLNLITDTYFESTIEKSSFKEHIEGSIEIGENMPRIAKLLMIMDGNLNISNVLNVEGGIKVEGVLTSTAVYKADDDEESLNSVQVEIPFSIMLDVENLKAEDELYVFGNLVDLIIKAKKGKELEIDADVVFDVEFYSKEAEPFVKDVVLTEEINQNPYPLAIYLAPAGSSLWDISKHLNVKEEIILEQNPNVEYPLDNAQGIVYFNQK